MIIKPKDMKTVVRPQMKGGQGEVSVKHLVNCDDIENIRYVGEMTLPAGAGIGQHAHNNETEFYVILKGSAVVDEGSGEVPVSEGDVIVTGGGSRHSLRNPGEEPITVLAFIVTQ